MKEMIKKIREDKGGFTLAELLIVVAIIAILVAIAIPVFTSSLAKANAATDEANIRAGYAEVSAEVLTDEVRSTYYTLGADGSVVKYGGAVTAYQCKGSGTSVAIGGQSVTWGGADAKNIYYKVDANGKVTITTTAPTN